MNLLLVILLAVCTVALAAAGILKAADYLTGRNNGLQDGGVTAVEYGTGSSEPLDYIDQDTAQIRVKDDRKIDTYQLGDQEITYIVTKKGLFGSSEKEITRIFTVSDTQAPVITTVETELARAVNDVLDLQDLILCTDPADGQLAYSDTLSPGNMDEHDGCRYGESRKLHCAGTCHGQQRKYRRGGIKPQGDR